MKVRLRINPLSLLLFLGVALLPVYVFRSGGVQPAHIVLALFATSVIFMRGLRYYSWSWLLIALSLWVLFIESIHGIALGGELRGVMNFVFFFYNFIITQSIVRHIEVEDVTPVYFGVLVASAIALISSVMTGVNLEDISESGRETATFNNPNQLGYFSVCLLALTYFLYVSKNVGYLIALGLFATALFLSVLSLSKAAMIANGIVSLLAMKPKLTRLTLPAFFIVAIGSTYFVVYKFLSGGLDQFIFIQRLSGIMSEDDSSLDSRGYFAFLDGNVLEIIFGMGSVGVAQIVGHEVHSTFASVMNNYGVFGLSLFVATITIWAFRIFRAFGFVGLFSIVGPPMLYGITHNGSRFVFFWILFATTLGYIERKKVNFPKVEA